MMIILCQWDFNEKNRKIGKVFTLYQREFVKKIPRQVAFCSQSVDEGLTTQKRAVLIYFAGKPANTHVECIFRAKGICSKLMF